MSSLFNDTSMMRSNRCGLLKNGNQDDEAASDNYLRIFVL